MTITKDYLKITPEIKEELLKISYIQEGVRKLDLGNSRLDFKTTYILEGFTGKGVNLSFINGTRKIKKVGKVYRDEFTTIDNKKCIGYKIVTEGWHYIESFGRKEMNEMPESLERGSKKRFYVDFESWEIEAKDTEELNKEITRRFAGGDYPSVSSVEESD